MRTRLTRHLSPSLRQQRVTEPPTTKHSPDFAALEAGEREHLPRRSTRVNLTALPFHHFTNKSTSGALFGTNPCRVILHPVTTGGECGHYREASPTSEPCPFNPVFFSLFVFSPLSYPGERSSLSLSTWTNFSSGSPRLASASNKLLSISPPVRGRRSSGLRIYAPLPLNAYRCRIPECKPPSYFQN